MISSISTTHAFAAEKEESRRYADGMSTYLQCVKRQAKLYFFYSSATFTFLPYSTYCLVLFYGAQLINTPEGCSNVRLSEGWEMFGLEEIFAIGGSDVFTFEVRSYCARTCCYEVRCVLVEA